MRAVLVAGFALAACGRIGFDASTSGGDAGDSGPATGPWVTVTAGYGRTCAITETGEAWCWGSNESGELGPDGVVGYAGVPAKLPGTWTTIAHQGTAACGIQTNGTLWCWGRGDVGQLGDGSASDHDTPLQVGTATDWIEVTGGNGHACARRMDTSAWCWGGNGNHEYAPEATSFTTPHMVLANSRSISAGGQHTVAVRDDGALMASGPDGYGELGTGTSGITLSGLTRVGTASDWARVATSNPATCAVKTDGTLWCWGIGDRGALGLGDESWSSSPKQVGGDTDWAHLYVGEDHSCATKSGGAIWCWGSTGRGALGAATDDALSPRLLAAGQLRSIAIGNGHTCTVDMLGALRCAGVNDHGQIRSPGATSLVPVQIDGPWTKLRAYRQTACGIDTTQNAWCWGRNNQGELGDGTRRVRQKPAQLAGSGWTDVAVGDDLSLGIRGDKLLWWGSGMLSPQMVNTAFIDWTTIVAAQRHVCALRANTSLYCWGGNNTGQVGNGNTMYQANPVLIGTSYSKLTAGGQHTCAVHGGVVECWGYNGVGDLGNGTQTSSSVPVQVNCPACTNHVVKLVSGNDFSCALLDSSAVWCWGDNLTGQFGDGAPNPVVTTPVAAAGGTGWKDVAAGDLHMCGLKADNTLWCWGHGDGGQLGNNTYPGSKSTPVPVGSATDWTELTAFDHGNCALRPGGMRWCWGMNFVGQYGDGASWFDDFIVVEPMR